MSELFRGICPVVVFVSSGRVGGRDSASSSFVPHVKTLFHVTFVRCIVVSLGSFHIPGWH